MKSTLSFPALVPVFLAALVSPVLAGVHEIWWNITYVQNASPDGLFERRVIGVNNTWPPTPMDVSTADSLLVHVTNSLDAPTTLHHHGMFFNSTSWMDGAQGVSECGIPPGAQFDYVIPVNTSGQWGTYWVHAHASVRPYVDGLRAPLLIHPPKEVHSYDEEFTVVLGDWYHDEHSVLLKEFVNIANPGGAEPIPGFNENATLPFVPGKTYRLRIVNTSAFAAFFFWIDGHDMRIIEVDGTDVEESSIDLISVTVAQRYSVLVTARNDTSANWAIHANMDTTMFDRVPAALNPNITTSITYNVSAPLTDLGFVNVYHDNATVASAYGPQSFVLDHFDVVDIVIKNGDVGKHPFHLHGHKVQIVGRSQDYTSSDPTLNPPLVEGQANPIRRDTVQIPAMNSATLRVVADNPLVEAPIQAQQFAANVPSVMYDHCKALGKPVSGNAAGFASTTDLDGLPLGPYPQKLGWHSKGIGAMAGCILAAVFGMASVVWYALGGHISDEEIEHEVRARIAAKEKRGKFFGLLKK
ncbi:Fet3 protein [Flammula alnicola]|nr:Fet3 protein [Flammula alnicola]